jgi:hypothetical protein
LFAAACNLGLEGIISKKLNASYRSSPSRTWIKVKNPKAPPQPGRLMVRSNKREDICCHFVNRRRTGVRAGSNSEKVATIIRSDKAKTQTYCEINKVSEQMNQAYGKNDKKTVDELSQKIDRLEKILGPEYIALMDGLQKLGPENKKRVAEIMLQFSALDRLCTK